MKQTQAIDKSQHLPGITIQFLQIPPILSGEKTQWIVIYYYEITDGMFMTFSDQKQIIAYNENIYTIMWIQYAAYQI